MLRQLRELARLHGIQTSYIDVYKQKHEADAESLILMLKAMGVDVDSARDVDRTLKECKETSTAQSVEPVLVAWNGHLGKLPTGEITLEDGSHHEAGKRLPTGYHRLQSGSEESLVISAPRHCYFPFRKKVWGTFAPIYALRSRRSHGTGDLTDFESVVDWTGDLGGSVAATLPLLASFLDEPFEPSPYAPASRLFWNEFYIDIERVPEFSHNRRAQRMMSSKPRQSKLVDYRAGMKSKQKILRSLANSFFADAGDERRGNFERFIKNDQSVADYAAFRAVTDRLRKGWHSWPSRMRLGQLETSDYREENHRYHLYVQWIVQEQLGSLSRRARSAGTALYLDLPLGIHPHSYDVWRKRKLFLEGVAGGAPPDMVFTKGQNWGFPPMQPDAMRRSGHEYTIAYIRNHLRYAQLLRVDHVMGLHRLYCIPDGLTGDKGVYVTYPADELYAILSVESHRNLAGVVGENLGTVPPIVNTSMKRHNVQKMYVVQYEIFGDKGLRTPARESVAGMNTHDMPPFRAFWDSIDIDDRLDLEFLTPKGAREEHKQRAVLKRSLVSFLKKKKFLRTTPSLKAETVFRALMAFLAASPAMIALVNLEDTWQETLPQNVPATHRERPNWRRTFRLRIEEMRRSPEVVETLKIVASLRDAKQRLK